MGTNIDVSVANNVDYNWYIDQYYTGTHWNVNCGPASVTMALKWELPFFNRTTEDARNTYPLDGGWWHTTDIVNYLNLYHARGRVIEFNQEEDLLAELDLGNIAILCLDMYYVRKETKGEQWAIDKFYSTENPESGHFIIVKGYKKVGNNTLFEVYDPWSIDKRYEDGRFMGLDRLYRSEDIMKATNVWWKYAIVIYPRTTKFAIPLALPSKQKSFDMTNIPNQKGR
ncbi:MAG: hypothetical protein LBU92_05900 [Prevotellaceae bacterium]|jgi:hypothetical protein|nr:hypothetical protein [Prevotellaceae bacterium]